MAETPSQFPDSAATMPSRGYAGDVDPARAWRMLKEEPSAALVDVRTVAEWSYVGLPDLSELGKQPILVEWQTFPDLAVNAAFVETVARAAPDPSASLIFLCRSGSRSGSAAMAMAARGYGRSFNLSGGFEGNPDADRHRGQLNGWKASGLPWVQS